MHCQASIRERPAIASHLLSPLGAARPQLAAAKGCRLAGPSHPCENLESSTVGHYWLGIRKPHSLDGVLRFRFVLGSSNEMGAHLKARKVLYLM